MSAFLEDRGVVRLTVQMGTSIKSAIRQAIRTALAEDNRRRTYGTVVEFVFNGTPISVTATSNFDEVFRQWLNSRES